MLALAMAPAAVAQQPVAIPGKGEIRGRLVDSLSRHAIESGSITIARSGDSSFTSGALPKPDGSFRVEGLEPGRYTIRVRALGYGPMLRSNVVITEREPVADAGALMLTPLVVRLEGQAITAERDEAVLSPDRNSYSTRNMPGTSGGTAVDVLRNVPLVEVDGSNKVSLRGNENVVVQINGRPSPLKGEQLGAFLAQLPARTIKNVEVATNPSAKNDPEGAAGIINIVLDQKAELGLSGGLSAATSSSGHLKSASGNAGMQSGPLTLFVSGSVYGDQRGMSGTISRTNLVAPADAATFVETSMSGTQRPVSLGGTLRSEYRFTDRDALSFDTFLYSGHFDLENVSRYADLNNGRDVVGLFDQFSDMSSHSLTPVSTLGFRRQGKPTQMQWESELEYSGVRTTNDANLAGNLLLEDPSAPSAIPTERDRTDARYPGWSFKSDYTQPFGTHAKLEAGVKGTWRRALNDFTAAYLDTASSTYVADAARTTAFDFHENISAGYALLSTRVAKLETQAGLRLESADTRLDLPLVLDHVASHYTSAFPSAILSYDFGRIRQAKLSYSRRVSRPGPHQLSPVEYRSDARNVFRGNPRLRPEYTDAVELGLQQTSAWGSVQLTPSVRHTSHAVRNIQFVDSTGVSVGTYDNVASTVTMGSDLLVNVRRGPLTLGGGGSAYHYSSDASNLAGGLSTKAVVWSVRANGTWRLSRKFDAQLFGSYRAPYATEGGSQSALVFMNAGARYRMWGDQGNVSLSISDPFGLLKFGYRTASGTVIEESTRSFGTRVVRLTISRNFGKAVKLRPRDVNVDPAAPPGPP